MKTITPHLWFDKEAREAAELYVSLFPDSKITNVTTLRDTPSGEAHVVSYSLAGRPFMAISAGPYFKFTPAISLFVNCTSQAEVDELWGKLTAGGQPQPCGWLTDKFGVSWQIIPTVLGELLWSKDAEKSGRAVRAMLGMSKIDIAALKKAYDGS